MRNHKQGLADVSTLAVAALEEHLPTLEFRPPKHQRVIRTISSLPLPSPLPSSPDPSHSCAPLDTPPLSHHFEESGPHHSAASRSQDDIEDIDTAELDRILSLGHRMQPGDEDTDDDGEADWGSDKDGHDNDDDVYDDEDDEGGGGEDGDARYLRLDSSEAHHDGLTPGDVLNEDWEIEMAALSMFE
jgi:hypothetical protein